MYRNNREIKQSSIQVGIDNVFVIPAHECIYILAHQHYVMYPHRIKSAKYQY